MYTESQWWLHRNMERFYIKAIFLGEHCWKGWFICDRRPRDLKGLVRKNRRFRWKLRFFMSMVGTFFCKQTKWITTSQIQNCMRKFAEPDRYLHLEKCVKELLKFYFILSHFLASRNKFNKYYIILLICWSGIFLHEFSISVYLTQYNLNF